MPVIIVAVIGMINVFMLKGILQIFRWREKSLRDQQCINNYNSCIQDYSPQAGILLDIQDRYQILYYSENQTWLKKMETNQLLNGSYTTYKYTQDNIIKPAHVKQLKQQPQ